MQPTNPYGITPARKGTLSVPKGHTSEVVYLEVSPTNHVTHIRVDRECFPVPTSWGLADIYQYVRGRHLWRVSVMQRLSSGPILRSAPVHLNDWLMQYALTAPGHALGIVHDSPSALAE
jgi:hypothetical protein